MKSEKTHSGFSVPIWLCCFLEAREASLLYFTEAGEESSEAKSVIKFNISCGQTHSEEIKYG